MTKAKKPKREKKAKAKKKPRTPRPATVRPPVSVGETVLALDVSSSCVGYALMRAGLEPDAIDFGLITPPSGLDVVRRSLSLAEQAVQLVKATEPNLVIIETTSGYTYRSDRSSSLASLAFAQGSVHDRVFVAVSPDIRVETVSELEWTKPAKGARLSKEERSEAIRRAFPEYDAEAESDPGFDIADSLGIAQWRISSSIVPAEVEPWRLYTDGSATNNGRQVGGWGFVLHDPFQVGVRELNGRVEGEGSNKMELRAVVEGLGSIPEPSRVEVYTDSAYVVRLAHNLTRGGSTKAGNDGPLWTEFRGLLGRHRVDFVKVVKGQAPDDHRRAHHLAREAATSQGDERGV